ncbi:MAG: hypothetical protein ACKO7P_04830 [Bacteroidota bacterium]
MEAFITRSNAERIVKKMDNKNLDITDFANEIQFKWFNSGELRTLKAFELFFSNPELFISECSMLKPRDYQQEFVFKTTNSPAYHYYDDCERMLSNYENIRIPESIEKTGRRNQFIEWCIKHRELREKFPDQFKFRLYINFRIKEDVDVIFENSGYQSFDAMTLAELEKEINKELEDTQIWLASSPIHRRVMEIFGIQSFNYKNPKYINLNRLKMDVSEEEVINCLRHIELEIKRPLMELFMNYYRLKENEGLSFDENILDHLGFRPCSHCKSKSQSNFTKRLLAMPHLKAG